MVGEPIEEIELSNELSEIIGDGEQEYEGLGGTDEEIQEILTEVIEGVPENIEINLNEEVE